MSEEEAAQLQDEVVARLTQVQVSGVAAADSDEG
jgi:hypothetical protein